MGGLTVPLLELLPIDNGPPRFAPKVATILGLPPALCSSPSEVKWQGLWFFQIEFVPHYIYGSRNMTLSRQLRINLFSLVIAIFVANQGTVSRASIEPVTLSFFRITSNAPGSSDAAGQLFVDVWSATGANSSAFSAFYGSPTVSPVNIAPADVLFVVRNTATIASSVTRVYFDDGTILGLNRVFDKDNLPNLRGNVDYSAGTSPPGSNDLPGGNAVGFETTAGFLAKSDPAVSHNGVNDNSDLLGISFSLINGQTYADTIASLIDGSLRVGLHVQGLPGGYSDSFVNNPPSSVIPEPLSLIVWSALICCSGLATIRRRVAV
jgi:hypothetical protein